jgi:hypothetical protein
MIPSGTVQVSCKYCGGTILVPPYLGGEVRRCPNHPGILAKGLCNDCDESYCDECLRLYDVEHGTLHLCPRCYRNREADKAAITLVFAAVGLVFGLLFIAASPTPETMVASAVFFIGFFTVPSIIWWIYRSTHLPKGVTLKERNETLQAEREARKAFGSSASATELYSRLLTENMQNLGPQLGMEALERRIENYVLAGMTRDEAIRIIAEDAGY